MDLSDYMRRDPNYTAILQGYRRIAIAVAILVTIVVVARLLAFLKLLTPSVAAVLPAGALLTGIILVGLIFYGHQWLSRRLILIAREAAETAARLNRDALTGLYNRAYFLAALEQNVFGGASRSVGYLHLDMDNLKSLNDNSGHHAGDAALVHLARIIQNVVPGAIVGRLGGDEFGILIPGHDSKADLTSLGEDLLSQLEAPVSIAGRLVRLSASIGIALAPQDTTDAADLLYKADLALYKAKRAGRRMVVAFVPDMLGDERQRRFIERELRAALLLNELEVHYQPIFDSDMTIRYYEALVRWRHRVRGMISPADFVPIAEESDLIEKLGTWVLRRVCADQTAIGGHPVAINVSPAQLRDPGFASRLVATLAEAGVDPHQIIVEITETVPLKAGKVELANLADLRITGVRIAIDDFGAGHASLQYLRSVAFDIIKIDRSYVSNLEANSLDYTIVAAVCDIARHLHVDVVGEGIETEGQLSLLRAAGCTRFQGFLLGRPTRLAVLLTPMVALDPVA